MTEALQTDLPLTVGSNDGLGVSDGARWYCVSRDGLAMLCLNEQNAQAMAAQNGTEFPNQAPYKAVALVDIAAERADRDRVLMLQQASYEREIQAEVEIERERLRGYFREALADKGITWPGEVDILYEQCFAASLASNEPPNA